MDALSCPDLMIIGFGLWQSYITLMILSLSPPSLSSSSFISISLLLSFFLYNKYKLFSFFSFYYYYCHFSLIRHFSIIEITMLRNRQYTGKCTNNIFWMHEYIVLCRKWHRLTGIFSEFIVSQFTKTELRCIST